MLSRAEADFLRGEKQAKPQQLRYLKHCVKKKIRAFEENDLPAILGNDWARVMFQAAIGNNSTSAIGFNSAQGHKQVIVPDDLHNALKGQVSTKKTSMARLTRSILAWPVEPDARVRSAALREHLDGGLSYDGLGSIDTGVSWINRRKD